VAYRDVPYELFNLENEIIDFILKKVVVMRELPFIKATNNLELSTDLKKI
jgi:hypothetical protein